MITIVCGTNRIDSTSRIICKVYQDIIRDLGDEAVILDLIDLPNDFTASALYEKSGKNKDFNKFREIMVKSEKFVFVVPEYNGSFPGVLKAFIDGLKFPDSFQDKKCGLVGLSAGVQGGGLAVSHLTDIFHYCGMHVMPIKPKLARIESHLEGEEITNDLYRQLLEDQARQLVAS